MKSNSHHRLLLTHREEYAFRKVVSLVALSGLLFFSPASAQQHLKPPPPQTIRFREGIFKGSANVYASTLTADTLRSVFYKNKFYTILQFNTLPGIAERKDLETLGYRLFDYLPRNAWLAEIPQDFSLEDMKRYGISGAYALPSRYKIAASLTGTGEPVDLPPDALIAVSWFGTLDSLEVRRQIAATGSRSIVATRIRPAAHVLYPDGRSRHPAKDQRPALCQLPGPAADDTQSA